MSKPEKKQLIIVTDLDGSLLDALTYSFEDATPALERIEREHVPLILCSSKTRAELELYRQRLQNHHPFIAENGGGIYIPEGYFPFLVEGEIRNGRHVISLGTPYSEIRSSFISLRERLKIAVRGFGDMSISEVASLTGLSIDEASLAKTREYGEPFVFDGPPDDRFFQAIEAEGLRWTQGRLFHIMGSHHKGKAVNILRKLFDRAKGPVELMGLGDSLNDLPFLLAVDRPVLIRRVDGSHDPRINIPGLYRTIEIGPAGWNEAVLKLLKTGSGTPR
jgi:mannosyl-3-phosphoglycerate phosphatase family protein